MKFIRRPWGETYTILTAIALMVGTIVGAGILSIPYVFAKAGFWTGIVSLILVSAASTLMTLYVAELALRTRNRHQLAGFAAKYLGHKWKYVMLLVETGGIYTILIAYLIGVGVALSNLFGGSSLIWSTVFFLAVSPLIYIGLKAVCSTELMITSAKLILLLGIVLAIAPNINPANLETTFNFSTLFIPFGVILFSTMGYTVIPEMEEALKFNKKKLKETVLISTGIVLAIYFIFALAFVGVFGVDISDIATVSLTGNLALFGNLFVLLTMTTPFISLSTVVKDIYHDDFNLDKRLGWFLAAFIPFMLFLYLDFDFVTLISAAGAFAFGLMGILTAYMVINARKQIPETQPEFVVPGGNLPVYFTIAIFIAGIFYHIALYSGII